jgi:hypothetical protein
MCARFLGPIDEGITDLLQTTVESSFAWQDNIVPCADPPNLFDTPPSARTDQTMYIINIEWLFVSYNLLASFESLPQITKW